MDDLIDQEVSPPLDELLAPYVGDGEAVPVRLEDFIAHLPDHSYIFRLTGAPWGSGGINARIQPIVIGKDDAGKDKVISAARWLDLNAGVEQMTWAPGEPEMIEGQLFSDVGRIERPGVKVFNLYKPSNIVPKKGDVTPWLEHIQAVYPDEGEHIIKWSAQRIQRPGQKLNHALVLGGQQGIGKDTILEPVKQAIGAHNFREISPTQALGRFNGHLKSVILRINEARDLGEWDRFALYDHLKPIIAAPPDALRIDEKNRPEHSIPNVVGVILTTNHKTGGIYLPQDDRRHFVAWSPLPEGHFSPEYFMKLCRWYEAGGNANVADYLLGLDISGFNPKAPPLKTEAFWQMVNSARAPESAEMADAIDALGNPRAFTIDEIKEKAASSLLTWLGDKKNSRAISHRLEDCGYEAVPNPDAKDGYWKINGRRQSVYAHKKLPPLERRLAASALR
jgi:hypothetical protein